MRKVCPECNEIFTAPAKNTIYCSKLCHLRQKNKAINDNWINKKKQPLRYTQTAFNWYNPPIK